MDSKSELLSMGGIGPQLHLVVFLRSAHGLYGPQNDSMQNQNKIPITSNGSIGSQPADLIICRFWYIRGGTKVDLLWVLSFNCTSMLVKKLTLLTSLVNPIFI